MNSLLDDIEDYVFETMKTQLPQAMLYHSYRHTVEVVLFCRELLSVDEQLDQISDHDQTLLLIAAWFHDLGFTKSIVDHEARSIDLATQFLKDRNFNQQDIDQVAHLINATKLEVEPKTILEEIIKDADTAHVATKKFKKKSELLRKELGLLGEKISKSKWIETTIDFLANQHRFYTKHAIENWKKSKNRNLVKLINLQEKNIAKQQKEEEKAHLKEKAKELNPERGIQTMYRVTLRNHLKLSDIADTKANILLSVNAIIISLALANLIPKLDSPSNYHLWWPTLILVLFSVASIILSIRSTQPKVSGGEFSNKELSNKNVNLLFFGNFFRMSYDDYQENIDRIIEDKDYIYKQLTKDLYYLGLVLQKKYQLLKTTYVVFTIGLITSVIAFIIAFINMEIPEKIIEATTTAVIQ